MLGDADRDLLFTAAEIAHIFRVSKTTIYNLMRRGEIPSVRMGRLVRVRLDDLVSFILEDAGLNAKEQNSEITRARS